MFLDLQINVLTCLGIFPPSSERWPRRAFIVYRTTMFVFMLFIAVTMGVQMVVATDLTTLARIIDIWTMFISGLYKWCYIAWFDREFADLNASLVRLQVQGSVARGQSARTFTADYLKRMRPITMWYMFSGLVASILIIANPLVNYPQMGRPDIEYFNDPNSYPLSCWIPFTIKNFWMFSAYFVCHCVAIILIVFFYLSIDSFMFGALYAAGGQIELLNSSIDNVNNSLAKMETSTITEKLMKFSDEQQRLCLSKIKECVKYHIFILKYIHQVRILFSSLIMADYLHGLISLSFALFQLTMSVSISELIVVMFFFLVSMSHQFLNNYFGEYIIQKQLRVDLFVNRIPWWRANKEIRYMLMLMILRSQKPLLIRGFYMYKLCNMSFISFTKALYTYYMVLRRINSGEKTI